MHAKDAASVASAVRDASADVTVVEDGADRLVVETSGTRAGILRVDRSFTPRVTATVDGKPATVYAADLHLIGVPVPAGKSRVVIDLAPVSATSAAKRASVPASTAVERWESIEARSRRSSQDASGSRAQSQ